MGTRTNEFTGGFIAVHGIQTLKSSYSALEAVTKAVMILEDSPLTNAGFGSNLTYEGTVECDASVMDGSNLQYGSIGAVSGVKNPVQVARALCQFQTHNNIGHGRIPPSFLVGDGALAWAKQMNIEVVKPDQLITEKAKKIYNYYKKKVESDVSATGLSFRKLDTVGAVCVDAAGNIASACSSGGIILKFPGRVGQAGIWGSGCWASNGGTSIGTSTTGSGEHLIRTHLAQTIANSVVDADCPTTNLHDSMQKNFIESRYLLGIKEKLGGSIVIRYNAQDDCGDFLWTHSTNSMIIGYMNANSKGAKSYMSTMPNSDVGKKCIVEGIMFKLHKKRKRTC
ncbi:unnamed protein product [Trichogramma brassicae]|uniref:Uncharacterized protein n=1 Tax=Trichogramma brassicae TaxID=86971 RepID=A0A6H5J966_9HYME|nr:unnamed protein product [Trichogramma brassicae]